ncbi:hypothetical protein [Flammeovirga sp. SJP92]|uniref:hypothetical protein n=1 Tax=Flammeovirga sp. SJP92 TaxID=1775430 RepID=UPI000788A4A0|nr:hypothetical protein [Flammeovirga sp. SJP92]KXX66652.1 hypothetical protein AVL50_30900 [Flammeovirga sp. SJP92]
MLIWSGRGILSLFVFIGSIIIFSLVLPQSLEADYKIVFSFITTALFSWFMGKRWNASEEHEILDETTGKKVVFREMSHSFFWIKMQYWGLISGVLGLSLFATIAFE